MSTRDLVRIALFAAVIAALGLLPKIDIPIAAGVPVTAQTLGVMLAGVFLGARYGAAAVALLLAVVALGAPFLAGGRGGLGVFFGPTTGFLLGWIPGVIVTGLVFRALPRLPAGIAATIAAMVGGVVVIHACGIAGLALVAGMPLARASFASLAFLPGDLLKAIATGLVIASMPAFGRVRASTSQP